MSIYPSVIGTLLCCILPRSVSMLIHAFFESIKRVMPGEESRKPSLSAVHHSSYCQIREECKRYCIRTSRSARSFMTITRVHRDVHSVSGCSSVCFDGHGYRKWLSACLIEFLSCFPLFPLPATTMHRCYSHCFFPVVCTTYSTICTCFSLKTDLLRMSFPGISCAE
jgi:hypothetical protein